MPVLLTHLIGTVELDEIPFDDRIDLAKAPLELLAREALRLRVDSFELAAVDRDDAGVQEIQPAAKGDELLAYLADGRTVVAPEVGDGLEVGRQAAREPDQLQIPPALALEAARGLHLVEIPVDVDLEHRCRMVARAAGLFWYDAVEAEPRQIERVDEGIDHANRVLLADVVVNRFRKKRRLRPIRALDEPPHSSPPAPARGNRTLVR